MRSSPSPSPRPHAIVSGHFSHSIHLPTRYRLSITEDGLQHVPSPLPLSSHQPLPDPEPVIDHLPPLVAYQTPPNNMGLFQVYLMWPSFISKGDSNIHCVIDASTLDLESSQHSKALELIAPESQIISENLYSAFSSSTVDLLIYWHYETNESLLQSWTGHGLYILPTSSLSCPSREHSIMTMRRNIYLHDQFNLFNSDIG